MAGNSTAVTKNLRAYDRIIVASAVSLLLEHLAEQFLHALPPNPERSPARRCRSIDTAIPALAERQAGPQVPLAFHAVQDGIERARAQSVTMSTKFVDHRLAEDRPLSRVMKDVESDETRIQVAVYHRFSSSEFDIEMRGYL
jgi:hypothetical protein